MTRAGGHRRLRAGPAGAWWRGAGWGGRLLATAILALGNLAPAAPARVVLLSTTTSVQDTGLLDVVLPAFERRTGLQVRPIAVGTGQALELAARGEADVVLAHAPDLERQYVAAGTLRRRRPVMANDFLLVGPPTDPAEVRAARDAAAALGRIAARGARFVSRGDRSGTHLAELGLWRRAGVEPRGPWYLEAGQGMAATLLLADDRAAYTPVDRATYLVLRRRVGLVVLHAGDPALRNVYSVLEVDAARGRVNAEGGRALAEFLLGAEAQALIGGFGVDRYGEPLFVPLAGPAGRRP